MIKTKLPTWEKVLSDDEKSVIVKDRDLTVTINTTIEAEQKWETEFKENSKQETLFAYVSRLKNIIDSTSEKDLLKKVSLVSCIKAFYCLIDSDEINTFKQFCGLFDASEPDRFDRLVKKMIDVFNLALTSSTASEKN